MITDTDKAIERLGIELLRELKALAWLCDAGLDGKYPMIPSYRRHAYEAGGYGYALVETGCVRLLTSSYCEDIKQRRPAIRMEQFGRRVLLRAKALGLNLETPEAASE